MSKFDNDIRTHFCNDNRRGNRDAVVGSALWAGRWWLHFFSNFIRFTWAFGKQAPVFNVGISLDLVYEGEISITLGVKHLFFLSVAFHSRRLPTWDYKHGNRAIELRIFNWGIWFDLWRDDDMPFLKRRIIFHPLDTLFGKECHKQRHVSLHEVLVPMPERSYPATVEMYLSEWKRPRSPRTRRIMRANIELEQPIPFPGKGENSWDLGEDATFGMTCPAVTPKEAVDCLITSVMRDRERYGGAHWQPADAR